MAGPSITISDSGSPAVPRQNGSIDQTRDRVEDFVYQATRKIKRSPLAAVALAFGVGALLGVVLSRNGRR